MTSPAAAALQSIVLVGGKGTRLAEQRKRLTREQHPYLDAAAWGTVGPKGLARMSASLADGQMTRPMVEWHLAMHAADHHIGVVTLALGFGGDLIRTHFQRLYGDQFYGLSLDYLIERNPAGTIAPLVQLHLADKLPQTPIIYANGDNLVDVELYASYVRGIQAASRARLDLDLLVIVLAALVPWRESAAYGTLHWDRESGLVHGFREKAPFEDNPWLELDGERVTPINSGISVINNPRALCVAYLDHAVVDCSRCLESGELDYAGHEQLVKYETLYERVAATGTMVAVPTSGYWSDLGTEERIIEAENRLPTLAFGAALMHG